VTELTREVTSLRKVYPSYKAANAMAKDLAKLAPKTLSSRFEKHNKRDLVDKHKSRFAGGNKGRPR
jgi:hypothetical protein